MTDDAKRLREGMIDLQEEMQYRQDVLQGKIKPIKVWVSKNDLERVLNKYVHGDVYYKEIFEELGLE